ncbi:hypothetical protein [Halopseudomonas sp.]|uniref:hypothetical protein n=1 Tax=Halopseudomonas sp. TaxID=2901191 RepID=UPI0035637290
MKYSNIIGTTAITLALGFAAPFAVADMHGDMEHDKKSEHYDEKKAKDIAPDASELGERTDTGMGIEARPGSDGTDRAEPGTPEVGLEPTTEGNM